MRWRQGRRGDTPSPEGQKVGETKGSERVHSAELRQRAVRSFPPTECPSLQRGASWAGDQSLGAVVTRRPSLHAHGPAFQNDVSARSLLPLS